MKNIEQLVKAFAKDLESILREKIGEQVDAVLKTTDRKPKAPYKRGKPKKSNMRPSPITGVPNHYRRFSYLEPEHRTKHNLERFKGWIRLSKDEMEKIGVTPEAIRRVRVGNKRRK